MDDPSVLASLLSRRMPLSSPYVTPSEKEVDRAMNNMENMEKKDLPLFVIAHLLLNFLPFLIITIKPVVLCRKI